MDSEPKPADGRPLDESEDIVSRESAPWSREVDANDGMGGTASEGANRPFFVVEADREPMENKPLTFGAEATRRMKRVAEAPIDLGDSAPFAFGFEGVVGLTNEACEGSAVSGFACGEWGLCGRFILCFSDFVCVRILPKASIESASVYFW